MLALLIKAGQGPKWETLPEAVQKRLLAACPVNPELTEYLKPHRPTARLILGTADLQVRSAI